MPLLDNNYPENALVNVRAEMELFYGSSEKINKQIIEEALDMTVKKMHRKWHPRWTKLYSDINIPITTGTYELPLNFKKMLRITEQSLNPQLVYNNTVDYFLKEFTSGTAPRRQIQWIIPPTSEVLAVRIYYFRMQRRALADSDLLDVEVDNIDVVKTGARMILEGMLGNLEEYDRYRLEFEEGLRSWVNDDTEPDIDSTSRPFMADGSVVDFKNGELLDEVFTTEEEDS